MPIVTPHFKGIKPTNINNPDDVAALSKEVGGKLTFDPKTRTLTYAPRVTPAEAKANIDYLNRVLQGQIKDIKVPQSYEDVFEKKRTR